MSKKITMTLAASCLAAISGLAQAQNNTITFHGEVVGTTCNPAVADGNYTVTLDLVTQAALLANGVGAYSAISAPFAVQLVGCPVSMSKVGVVLSSSAYHADTGNLTDPVGYPSDAVQIRVMDGTDTTRQVVVGAAAPVTSVAVVDGAARIPMTAYYYVNHATTVPVGKIKATAVYALRTQ